jgi:hypothetical protein
MCCRRRVHRCGSVHASHRRKIRRPAWQGCGYLSHGYGLEYTSSDQHLGRELGSATRRASNRFGDVDHEPERQSLSKDGVPSELFTGLRSRTMMHFRSCPQFVRQF